MNLERLNNLFGLQTIRPATMGSGQIALIALRRIRGMCIVAAVVIFVSFAIATFSGPHGHKAIFEALLCFLAGGAIVGFVLQRYWRSTRSLEELANQLASPSAIEVLRSVVPTRSHGLLDELVRLERRLEHAERSYADLNFEEVERLRRELQTIIARIDAEPELDRKSLPTVLSIQARVMRLSEIMLAVCRSRSRLNDSGAPVGKMEEHEPVAMI